MRIAQILFAGVLACPVSALAQPNHTPGAEVGVQAGRFGVGPRISLNLSPRTAAQFQLGFMGFHEGAYAIRLRHTPDPAFKWYIAGGVMGAYALAHSGQTRSGVFFDRGGYFTAPLLLTGTIGRRVVERPRWSASAEGGIVTGAGGGVTPTFSVELAVNVGRLSR